jgi:hypothetical protein
VPRLPTVPIARSPLTHPASAAALALFVALALFGARYHWVEEAGSAERDGYVRSAEVLLAGEVPEDPYRPLLYPLLVAGLTHLGTLLGAGGIAGQGGDQQALLAFTVARLVSNLAAATLARLAYSFGARLDGTPADAWSPAGGWAFLLVAVNPNLWLLGQAVATDMLFAALAGSAVLAGASYLRRPRLATALGLGLALGAATFTRTTGLFLVPGLALAWWGAAWQRAPGQGADVPRPLARWPVWGHALAALATAAAVVAPHFWLRQRSFGDPFHDEGWKNLAWKLHGGGDWSLLEGSSEGYGGLVSILRAEPLAVARSAAGELARFATGGFAQLAGTELHALLAVAGGLWLVLFGRRVIGGGGRGVARETAWLAVTFLLFLIATAVVFFAWGRLLLAFLPVAMGLGAAGLVGFGRQLASREDGRLAERLVPMVLALGVLLLAAKTFAFRLPAAIELHPYTEVETLRSLDAEVPVGTVLAGTSPFLGRYLERPYLYVPDAFGDDVDDAQAWFGRLETVLRGSGARYLVVGRSDLRSRPAALVGEGGAEVPPWLVPAGGAPKSGVTVWRVDLPAAPAKLRWPRSRLPEGPYEWDLESWRPVD